MITHLLFKGLNSFNIGSSMFRKILSVIVAILIFSLVFLAVKFTKVEVPNFNRNLIMLAVVDISAFGLVMWKFGSPTKNKSDEKRESVEKEEAVTGDNEKETEKEIISNKTKNETEVVEVEKEDVEDVKKENTEDEVEDVKKENTEDEVEDVKEENTEDDVEDVKE